MNNETKPRTESRMPLYLQVAKLMRQKIESQQWRFGEQIPTLDNLVAEFEVSRITLRAALNLLEDNGIITRTRGLGTFVAKDLSEQRWFRLPNRFDELVKVVSPLKIHMLPIEPGTRVQDPAFGFDGNSTGYQRLRRVHYRENTPYCLIDIYLDQTIFDSDPEGFSQTPVVPQLAGRSDITIHQARQVLRITVSDKETASHLHIGVGDPIADVCRVFKDPSQKILYYAHIQYPAQLIQIDTDLLQNDAPQHPALT
ncbi:GntR family transcriptional regulator [Advenella kashmirensis]|nr:GntR family transcriptional regulator [Advenella kashmirensis]